MRYLDQARSRSERGFSLIEMVIVGGLILVLAAIAMPGISRYIRNYRINGAVRDVSAEFQTARSQAVSKNARTGVSLVIVGPTTYRFVREDIAAGVAGRLGPLRDLPLSVRFQPGAAVGLRFTNLGATCVPGTANCGLVLPPVCDPAEIASTPPRCFEVPVGGGCPASGCFVATPALSEPQVNLLETETTLTRQLRIGSGGRVNTDLQ